MKNYRRKPENPALDIQVRYEHLQDTMRRMVASGAVRFSPGDEIDALVTHGIIEAGGTSNARLREILENSEESLGREEIEDLVTVTKELLIARKVLEEVLRWRLGVGSQECVHTVLEAYLRGEIHA